MPDNSLTKTVTRFLHWCENTHGHGMQESLEGNWVRYDDIKHLLDGEVTVTRSKEGDPVAVTRTDSEGRILHVYWVRPDEPAANPIQTLLDDVDAAMRKAGFAPMGTEPESGRNDLYPANPEPGPFEGTLTDIRNRLCTCSRAQPVAADCPVHNP